MTQTLPRFSLCALLLLTALGGCSAARVPDNRIKLVPTEDGEHLTAVPPECLSWTKYAPRSFENQPLPQYGCATARNLAAQVARPEDLIQPNELGSANGVTTAAAQSRYLAGKTTPLNDPNANTPGSVIKMEDNRVGGGGSKQ